jgi:hypothetical protein
MSYYVGLDLGQSADYTALAVIEDAPDQTGEGARELHLRYLERYPLKTPYNVVADNVLALVGRLREHSSFGGLPHLLVDNTGVGKAACDLLRERLLTFEPVTITGGEKATRADGEWRVPKKDLVAALEVPFHTGVLKVAAGLDLWPALRGELLNFRRKVSLKTGHDSYEHWRETDHDDLVLAAALASWGAARFPPTTPPTLPTLRPSYWSGAQR